MTKVLLVEDNDMIRENTGEILELANYVVTLASNGKEGYEKALKDHFDIIICDIMMPVLDGYGLFHLICRNEELKGIPFIFLTAKTERSDFRKGMEMGADDYLTKPFTDVELMNAIETQLKKYDAAREKAAATNNQNNDTQEDEDFSLEQLLEDVSFNRYKKKQRIYAEGANPHGVFYLKSGKVRTYKTSDSGKELTVGLFKEGDFFGYFALIEGTVYKESAETMEACEIGVVSRDEFEMRVSSHKKTAQKFIKLLAGNVTEKEEQMVNIAYNSLRKRVANAIMFLYRKYKAEESEKFIIQISREDLAHIAGTTTESLIRTISDFRQEKLISTEGSSIKVLDKQKLLAMIN